MFFVISGFVIMTSVQSRQARFHRFSISDFVARRIRRLVPVMTVVVTFTMILTPWFATISSRTQTMRTGVFSAVSAANIYLFRFRPDGYFHDQEKSNPLLHMWSLSVEEQFYLGFAIIMMFLGLLHRSHPSSRLQVGVFGIVGFLSLVSCIVLGGWTLHVPQLVGRILGREALDSDFNFYLPFTRAWEFIAGILLVVTKNRFGKFFRSRLRVALALVLFAVSMFAISEQSVFPGSVTILPVAMTVLLIGTHPISGPIGAFLSSRALRYVGDRSYGWYLWHWPLIQFVDPVFPGNKLGAVSAAGLSFVLSMVSYRLVEVPYMSRELTVRRSLGTVFTPIAAAILVFVVPVRPFSELDLHLDAARGCESGSPREVELTSSCTLDVPQSRGRAILLGDSHAGQLSEGFVIAAHEMNLDATIAVNAGKPLLAETPTPIRRGDNQILDAVIDQSPTVVMIAQSRYRSLLPNGTSWEKVFLPIVEYLHENEIPVVITNTSTLIEIEPMKCSWISVLVHRCVADTAVDRTEVEARVAKTLVEESVALKSPSVEVVNLIDVFCDQQTCAARQDGKWMWRDSSHMSRYASELTAPVLLSAMRRVAGEP